MEIKIQQWLENSLCKLCDEYDEVNTGEVACHIAMTLAACDISIEESYLSKILDLCIIDGYVKYAYISWFFGAEFLKIRCDCVSDSPEICLVRYFIGHEGYANGARAEFNNAPEFIEAGRRIENLRIDLEYMYD